MTQADKQTPNSTNFPATISTTDFQQWHRFIQDHCYRWQGVLSRYSQQGQLTDVFDSIRHFTVNDDASSINHALNFTHRTNPGRSLIKAWNVEKCSPGITHPVDPKSRAFFTTYGSGIMSRPFNPEETNYAELYLNCAHYRTSMVIMYHPEEKDFKLAQISLFRETRTDDLATFWSVDQCDLLAPISSSIQLANQSITITKTIQFNSLSLAESEITIDVDFYSDGDDRQIFLFPDGLALNIPVQLTPGTEHYLIMSWAYESGKIKGEFKKIKRAIAQFPADGAMPLLVTQIGELVEK